MNVKLFADFRDLCGEKIVSVGTTEPQSIASILSALIEEFPVMQEELFTEQGELKPLVHVFVNGKNIIHLDGLETTVTENDQISLFPPVAGG